ncbi:hypothetical protein V9K92_01505 [Phyllobacterium sp. CCNWLW109]|uniref:hypothetical protein n=1 Tax=Phyllobacterium sp. CCNWLW109 TaxID=3127479 RepID=UPI003078094E
MSVQLCNARLRPLSASSIVALDSRFEVGCGQSAKRRNPVIAKLDDGFGGIVFGEEGQRWEVMMIDGFLAHSEIVDHLKIRLRHYLSDNS